MYRTLTTPDQAEALIAGATPAWIFKHSTSCSISSAAFDAFTAHCQAHPDQEAGVVVVQESRPLSTWIAQRLGRVHQSPQVFLVRAGSVLWLASHWSITAAALAQAWQLAQQPLPPPAVPPAPRVGQAGQ
jgi:bacillithiol system protein YtxJ